MEFEILARIANPPPDLLSKYTRREQEFFLGYAEYVRNLVSSDWVKVRLRHLLIVENFHLSRQLDLRVMVFPAKPLNGRPRSTLHGSYNQDSSQISIYPLKLPKEWVRLEGKEIFRTPQQDLSPRQRKFLSEAAFTAISTLIHEVLHVKFENRGYSRYTEEAIVRKLERQYAEQWLEQVRLSGVYAA